MSKMTKRITQAFALIAAALVIYLQVYGFNMLLTLNLGFGGYLVLFLGFTINTFSLYLCYDLFTFISRIDTDEKENLNQSTETEQDRSNLD